ncbi:MAG: hypothetical protein H7125_10595 [Proteobacteria bacterium]|nr:hypothetical protein [Burkholderiales bacterium]
MKRFTVPVLSALALITSAAFAQSSEGERSGSTSSADRCMSMSGTARDNCMHDAQRMSEMPRDSTAGPRQIYGDAEVPSNVTDRAAGGSAMWRGSSGVFGQRRNPDPAVPSNVRKTEGDPISTMP